MGKSMGYDGWSSRFIKTFQITVRRQLVFGKIHQYIENFYPQTIVWLLRTDSLDGNNIREEYIARCSEIWTRNREIVLHDPLTVYYALHPEICISEEVPVYLERQSPVIRGMTANLDLWFNSDKAAAKRVKCAKKVDAEKFIEIFFNYLYQR